MPKKYPDGDIGFVRGADTQCWVMCKCDQAEEDMSISDYEIRYCPHCGRGYITEFVVWMYEPYEDEAEPDA